MKPVDMSPAAVTARLRHMSELREPQRRAPVDMSPAAVGHRLREVSQLRTFCVQLERIGRANGLGKPGH